MNLLLVSPIIIPMLTALLCLLAFRSRRLQRILSTIGAAALLVVALRLLFVVASGDIQSTQVGNWPAPFGITIVADIFSSIMVVVTGIIGFSGMVYSLNSIDVERENLGYHPLYHFLLMGVCGAFMTGDLFNLYVWFEVLLMASFVLMVLGGERGQMEGGLKYFALNLLSSALFLTGLGIMYGLVGTLNMADVAQKFSQTSALQHQGLITSLSILFLVAFGIKAAVFPLFFWLPASYHTPPAAVSAVFAGLLTKVGVYALIRVFTLIFVHDVNYTHTLILFIAGLTMLIGVLGAVAQMEFRRVLSFHIVSQIGYMILGLGFFTPLAVGGSVFYIAHHIIVKANLFLVGGAVESMGGTAQLKNLGGLYRARPVLAVLFLIPAMSLAGVPPLSGFFAKLSLVQAGLNVQHYALVAIALLVGLLTLFSMMKLWNEAFWKPTPEGMAPAVAPRREKTRESYAGRLLAIGFLAALTLAIGLGAEPLFTLALRAGEQLMNPAEYIQAVLGTPR